MIAPGCVTRCVRWSATRSILRGRKGLVRRAICIGAINVLLAAGNLAVGQSRPSWGAVITPSNDYLNLGNLKQPSAQRGENEVGGPRSFELVPLETAP